MGIYVGEIPELHWRHWEIQDTVRFNRHQRTLAVEQVNLWEIFSAVFQIVWECIDFAPNFFVTSPENLHRPHKQSNASRKPIVTQSLGCSLGSISAALSCLVFAAPREERWVRVGSYSRTAAGNWAAVLPCFRQMRPSYTLRLLEMFLCFNRRLLLLWS